MVILECTIMQVKYPNAADHRGTKIKDFTFPPSETERVYLSTSRLDHKLTSKVLNWCWFKRPQDDTLVKRVTRNYSPMIKN